MKKSSNDFVLIDDTQAERINTMPDGTRVVDEGDQGDLATLKTRIRRLEAQESEWRKYFNAVLGSLEAIQGEIGTTHDDIIEAFTETSRVELDLENGEDKL